MKKKMKPNPMTEVDKPIKKEDLPKVEKALGFPLPESLKAHYLKYNGGQPKRTWIVTEDGDEYTINYFFPMVHTSEESPMTVEDYYEQLVTKKKLLPKNLIPFADDDGGDLYTMDKDTGEIYYYAMDTKDPKKAKRHVADTLENFLQCMITEEQALG